MYLQQAVSYGNAWARLVEGFPRELEDIQAAVAALTPEGIAASQPIRDDLSFMKEPGVTRFRLEGCWATAIRERGWEEFTAAVRGAGSRPIHMRALGYRKNGVSVVLNRFREHVNRWLYTLAPIAVRNGLVELPINISLMTRAEEGLFHRRTMNSAVPERLMEELLALSPLSHGNPFLLLGISLEDRPLDLVEIASEDNGATRQVVINRAIEFPPEYHQAGLGILSYFGTVLREKYPAHNATVRIEQEGLRVRLVIESDNGDREVIEKALQEYELVVRGETRPDEFFDSKAKVLELKNELRIAQVRIESQRELIAYQGQEISTLQQLIGHALSSTQSQPISVTVNPAISVNASAAAQLYENVPLISEYVQELARRAANAPDIELRLLDLEGSVSKLLASQTPEKVRESSAIKKLKGWLDDAGAVGSSVNAFLRGAHEGIELAQKLARRYNALAEWCGAPQVPSIFLGTQS